MPRRPKQGLDYAGWSVDIFDGDTKIDKLLDAHGWCGFSIYFFLCQMAYKFDGYFYRWSYDDASSTARRMGAGIRSGTVEEAVRCCLQIGLFDKGLFESSGILTSKGIQRRFYAAIQDRRVKSVIKDYWLLSDDEAGGLDKCAKNNYLQGTNSYLQPAKAHLQGTNDTESKVKESKGKGSKDIGADKPPARPRFVPPTVEEVTAYCSERNNNIDAAHFVDYYTSNGWHVGKQNMKDWKAAVRTWERNGFSTKAGKKTTGADYTAPDGFDFI